jgi:hypothetical protein
LVSFSPCVAESGLDTCGKVTPTPSQYLGVGC